MPIIARNQIYLIKNGQIKRKGSERQTSVEPKNERLGGGILSGLKEPIKESPTGLLIDSHIARVVGEADVERLTRKRDHQALELPLQRRRRGDIAGGGGEEEEKGEEES